MRQNRSSLGHAEITLLIQGRIEALDPQQVLARDLLMEKLDIPLEPATQIVREIGALAAAALRVVLQQPADGRSDVLRNLLIAKQTDVLRNLLIAKQTDVLRCVVEM